MDKNRAIAVLGGGNVGHTLAADLTLGGHKVIWYEHVSMKEKFQPLIEYGKVNIYDEVKERRATAKIYKYTMDMQAALKDVDLIFVAIASYGQEIFFPEMIPHLKDNHIIYVMTGNSGALRLKKLMKDVNCRAKPVICETNTMPYGTRVEGFASVRMFYGFGPWSDPDPKPEEQPLVDCVAALPASKNKEGIDPLRGLFPLFEQSKNVLVVASSNSNMCFHPTSALLNTGRIESSGGNFYSYREGILGSPAVQYAVGYISDELGKITNALGGRRVLTRERVENFWKFATASRPGKGPMDPIGPQSLKDRYITEDVPYALLPMEGFAEKLGVEVPFISALITVGSVVCREDFRKTGRTMQKLGIGNMSKDQLIEYVTEDKG